MTDEGERAADRDDGAERADRDDGADRRRRTDERVEDSRSGGTSERPGRRTSADETTGRQTDPDTGQDAASGSPRGGSTEPVRTAEPTGGETRGADRQQAGRDLGSAAADAVTTRVGAYLLDFTLLSIVSVLTFVVVFVAGTVLAGLLVAGSNPDAAEPSAGLVNVVLLGVLGVSWFLVGVLVFAYYTLLDPRGGTLGKRALDLAVVDADGATVSTRSAALRTAVLLAPLPVMAGVQLLLALLDATTVGFLLAMAVMVGWLLLEAAVMAVSDDGQRLGDRLAGTYVVRD